MFTANKNSHLGSCKKLSLFYKDQLTSFCERIASLCRCHKEKEMRKILLRNDFTCAAAKEAVSIQYCSMDFLGKRLSTEHDRQSILEGR